MRLMVSKRYGKDQPQPAGVGRCVHCDDHYFGDRYFGLALLILGKKMKEISVRKVLGAGIGHVVFLINKEFLYAIGFAVLVGFPFSWWVTGNLFRILAPDSAVSFSPLIVAFFGLIAMTAISVSWHIYKAHTANPTQYLKEE